LDFQSIVSPWSIIVSDGLGLFIEEPLLLSSTISPSLEPYVSVTVHFSNSVEWKLRDEIEWSVDVEAKFFIESLSLKLNCISIYDLPSLVGSVMFVPYNYWLSFNIFSS
jgi:hypothetical protein